jgi:hypothetical protein
MTATGREPASPTSSQSDLYADGQKRAGGRGGVLIVADARDVLAAEVAEYLRRRGTSVVWVDPRSTPTPDITVQPTATGPQGWVRAADPSSGAVHEVDLAKARGWYRLPVTPAARAAVGWRDTPLSTDLETVWSAWHGWLNAPAALAVASSRLVQLSIAAQAGIAVAAVVATTRTAEVQRFRDAVGPVRNGPLTWPAHGVYGRVSDDDLPRLPATELLLLEDDTQTTGVVQVAVADQRMVAWRTPTEPDGPTVRTVEPVDIPDDARAALTTLMVSLGLRLAVVDFLVGVDFQWRLLGLDAMPASDTALVPGSEHLPALIAHALIADVPDLKQGPETGP